ncbi:MAG: 2-amino-4-hydroxy-6-hydroxymethyldihydropteridine diphosphokinase [Gammaproteobacteria bacterium]|nr:2-amino-4-hydroxy-6-hydroxymethyldihydropteridine diphosphokinase [Gammaproteobacteria bacterium]MCP5317709.1 2-amino-4-hydroxy-6-hydroxymethyldihydropteridine diphosphokinase [Chromatiaceae bacterium]MCW5587170.1 2-amino-4-hydroxy-6-hydroxymethyldihydropteridine diphosphokinase [Chromatiales bacterium]MCB1817153.1 2-amino-4-hydroxy-6-hydroxymethyldihydropteridine diphosphokinase [Gammaproteobacteria bacterium]MCP5429274.1 2-amino-4-hydroxy-6-hydroxymethyldihydropteridine diphosphokinase [Ch
MPRVWVSVGSNIDRERHIRAALRELRQAFGELTVSPVYETAAVGFDGDAFLNLVVGFVSELPPAQLHRLMRAIEDRHGRRRDGQKFSARTLDLDVLTYGDTVGDDGGKALPRDEILRYAFVLAPLADVAGDERHPVSGEQYRDLWKQFAQTNKAHLQRLDDTAWLQDWDSDSD